MQIVRKGVRFAAIAFDSIQFDSFRIDSIQFGCFCFLFGFQIAILYSNSFWFWFRIWMCLCVPDLPRSKCNNNWAVVADGNKQKVQHTYAGCKLKNKEAVATKASQLVQKDIIYVCVCVCVPKKGFEINYSAVHWCKLVNVFCCTLVLGVFACNFITFNF